MGEVGRRPNEGSSSRSSSSWSHPPVDLSGDKALVGAETIDFEGEDRPSVGKIALLREIGRGGMGVVYFGVNPRLQREVAVKILPSALKSREDSIVERFVQEARFAAHLESPHLVNVLDVDHDESSDAHFIVMEYVNGRSAREWMDDLEASGKQAPEKAALEVCIGATRGLKSAHMEGILHRDIKPHNILVPADKSGMLLFDRAKLADLGLARPEETGEEGITSTQIGMGTPGYVAPEQAQDARAAQKSSDVFGMGATLYGMLTGKAPFRGANAIESILRTVRGEYDSIRDLRPDVSEATAAIIERCLPPEPEERFKDAASLLEALELAYNALKNADTAEHTINMVTNLVLKKERGKKVVVKRRPRAYRRRRRQAAQPNAGLVIGGVVVLAAVAFLFLRGGGGATADPGLHVASTPEGATVRIDGRKRGVTPLFLSGLSGTVHIRITKRGYQAFERKQFLIAEGDRVDISPVLSRAKAGVIEVRSEPHGATVTVDGRERGMTPLVVRNLDDGRHRVVIEAEGHEPHEETVAVRAGDSVPLSVKLQVIQPVLAVLGPPHTEITLTGQTNYTIRLGAAGRADRQIAPGTYKVKALCSGFAPFESTLRAKGGSARIDLKMAENPGRLTVASVPPGAEVLVDDKPVGTTPLQGVTLAAGKRTITLRLADHMDDTRKEQVRGDRVLDLGTITLQRWCTLDLSGLDAAVVARIGPKRAEHGQRVSPGELRITLQRPGYAEQVLSLRATSGPVKVYAKPWDGYQARVLLTKLPEGCRVFVGDEQQTGDFVALDRSGDVDLRIERPGYAQVVTRVSVELGKTRELPALKWDKIITRLDLSDYPLETRYRVGRKSFEHGEIIPAGDHDGELVVPGRSAVPLRLHVTTQEIAAPPLSLLSHPAMRRALDWLAKMQLKNGAWAATEGRQFNAAGVSGLAMLCFLKAGETNEVGPHKDVLARGLALAVKSQDRDGCIGPRNSRFALYNHACMALAVIEAYRRTGDEEFHLTASRAVDFVLMARNPGRAWSYGLKSGQNDTVTTGWMVRVLAAAQAAGIEVTEVDEECFAGARSWLDQVTEPDTGRAGYELRGGPPSRLAGGVRYQGTPPPIPFETDFPKHKTESPTAVALLARLLMKPTSHSGKMIDRGFKLIKSMPPKWEKGGAIDMHYWYFATLASYRSGGQDWKRWSRVIERVAEKNQLTSGANAGSWDPVGAWGKEGGRVYSTAMMCLSLARVYRYESLK